MDWLTIVLLAFILYLAVAIVMILVGDCDLCLQIIEKWGKSPAEVSGKVVWITGASSGIGEHLAYELAKANCRLVLSARREIELRRVKKECLLIQNVSEEDIMILPLDVTDYKNHKEAVIQVLRQFSQIDILINNAGQGQRAEWVNTSIEADRYMFETNVLGAVSLTKQVLPHMIKRQRGHIVVMSSLAGKLGAALLAGSYFGTKHALQGWFDALRPEIYCKNIGVTCICPGEVTTNILQHSTLEEHTKTLQAKLNPDVKRMKPSRCAYLTAVAIANGLDEVWVSSSPGLLCLYLNQYLPNVFKWIAKITANMMTKKILAES